MQSLQFKRVLTTDKAYQQVFDLREALLRKPIGLSLNNEDLTDEVNDFILAAFNEDKVVACLILTPKDEQTVQLRQMAVAEHQQGKQVGKQLVAFSERFAKEHNYRKIVLHARIVAKGFYEKLVYKQTSDIFTEVGIPHVVMEKQLT